jgi:hypothetical protein
VADRLIKDFGYRLYPLAFSDAYRLADDKVYEATIPAMTYSVDPPIPPKDTPTLARRLLLVGNRNLPDDAVIGVLAAVFESGFARRYSPALDVDKQLDLNPEFPRHPGADMYRNGRLPLTEEQIAALPKLAPALGAAVPAIFFMRRTIHRFRNRSRVHKLRDYMVEVTQIEGTVRDWELGPQLSSDDLLRMRNRLSRLKSEALEKYAAGVLIGEELLPTFLAHVTDVRNYLSAMIKDPSEDATPTGAGDATDDDESWLLPGRSTVGAGQG